MRLFGSTVCLELTSERRKVAAEKLVSAGCRGLGDLSKAEFMSMLQPIQKIGFKYLDHITQPVLRAQAEKVLEFIRKELTAKSPQWEFILVGS